MSRNVLFTTVIGGLLGGGLIGGCGEDAAPGGSTGGGNEGEGSAEGEGEGTPNEGEGEGPLLPGGDREPCGDGNTCKDGLECMTCEEGNVESVPDERSSGDTKPCEGRICTCPQWFGGAWWFEANNLDTHGYEYDLTVGLDGEFWMDQEIEFDQIGCQLKGPDRHTLFYDKGIGMVDPPPRGFYYERRWFDENRVVHPFFSRGHLSEDKSAISGTCDGEYADVSVEPIRWFRLTCNFTLTRR